MPESVTPIEVAKTDESLLVHVQAGDHVAFEELVQKHKTSITRFAFMLLNDRAEAEDIAQVVFTRAFFASSRFRFGAKFKTWLFAIARNLCLNELRRRSRQRMEPLDQETTSRAHWDHWPNENASEPTAPEVLSEQEFLQKLESALASLPETHRKVILLLKEEELSYEEMANLLGISLPATKSLIFRSRQALRQKLESYWRLEEQETHIIGFGAA